VYPLCTLDRTQGTRIHTPIGDGEPLLVLVHRELSAELRKSEAVALGDIIVQLKTAAWRAPA